MTPRRLHLDFETASAVDIKKVGAHVYAEHPTTFAWLCRYRFNNEPTKSWKYWQPLPQEVIDHIAEGGLFVAHNIMFEWLTWNIVLPRQLSRTDLPKIRFEQTDCTMARAYCCGMPGSLEVVADVLETDIRKDMKGSALMKRMARPRKTNADGTYTWWNDPDKIEALDAYCDDDVEAETGVDDTLPEMSYDDRETWLLDLHMNQRGIHLDRKLIDAANNVIELEKRRINAELARLTNGQVQKASQRNDVLAYLNSFFEPPAKGKLPPITSLAKGEIEEVEGLLKTLSHQTPMQVLKLYQSANRTSTAKFSKMAMTICKDGRSRGTVQCHGAFTGRWSGRLWQPQNLPRSGEDYEMLVQACVQILLECDAPTAHQLIHMFYGDVMDAIVLCVRAVVCAEEGNTLVGADYSNIEGRLISWLAGAEEKLAAFRAQDRKEGYDLYNLSYAKSFGIAVETMPKKSFMRQIGKVQELACGYQGSIGAYINMAANYGIKPEEIAEVVLRNCTAEEYQKAADAYAQPGAAKFELEREVWIGLKIVVTKWRNSPLNRDIMQFWWDLQDAALEAVNEPGKVVYVGKTKLISYVVADGFMWCRLPTGKVLAYCNPRVRSKTQTIVRKDGTEYERVSWSVEYDGWDGEKRRWGTIHLYGGLQANHVTQGTAAAIMKRGMKNLEAGKDLWGSGYVAHMSFPNILTVHDEAVSEIRMPANDDDAKKVRCAFEQLMLSIGNEFEGLPLAASGWMDKRYVK